MKTVDFLSEHSTCHEDAEWALSISADMADVWDELVKQRNCKRLLWTATRSVLFPDTVLRKLTCRFIRETPLADGRMVWDLLIDERSRKAVEVAEAYADGNATKKELVAAYAAADAAAHIADAAADAAAHAARAAAAAYAAANAAAASYAATSYAARIAAAAYNASWAAAFAAADAVRIAAPYAADAARVAAYDSARAVYAASLAASWAAARAAACAAYATAADTVADAADAAQVRMIAELGNPFKKES